LQADPQRVERAITAVTAGDRSAVHYLYVRYADELCSHLSGIVGGHGDAEDLTQAVFLGLPRAIATYDPGELPFDRWLLRLAHDAAVLDPRRELQSGRAAANGSGQLELDSSSERRSRVADGN
jgi:DNA-directed RNA polymerase specialized sigma24 family protein